MPGTPPVVTPAGSPGGIKLPNGWQSTLAMSLNPSIAFYEQTIMPPGIDGGDAIPQTTMRNNVWRTFAPRGLRTVMPITIKAAYDPGILENFGGTAGVQQLININQAVTIHWPDGSAVSFYAWVQKCEFEALEEGKQPLATITLTPSNMDVNGIEVGPVITSAHGT
jgi:hypothetical protein